MLMEAPFKNSFHFNTFATTREWRNGRRAGLRIRSRLGTLAPFGTLTSAFSTILCTSVSP